MCWKYKLRMPNVHYSCLWTNNRVLSYFLLFIICLTGDSWSILPYQPNKSQANDRHKWTYGFSIDSNYPINQKQSCGLKDNGRTCIFALYISAVILAKSHHIGFKFFIFQCLMAQETTINSIVWIVRKH